MSKRGRNDPHFSKLNDLDHCPSEHEARKILGLPVPKTEEYQEHIKEVEHVQDPNTPITPQIQLIRLNAACSNINFFKSIKAAQITRSWIVKAMMLVTWFGEKGIKLIYFEDTNEYDIAPEGYVEPIDLEIVRQTRRLRNDPDPTWVKYGLKRQ